MRACRDGRIRPKAASGTIVGERIFLKGIRGRVRACAQCHRSILGRSKPPSRGATMGNDERKAKRRESDERRRLLTGVRRQDPESCGPTCDRPDRSARALCERPAPKSRDGPYRRGNEGVAARSGVELFIAVGTSLTLTCRGSRGPAGVLLDFSVGASPILFPWELKSEGASIGVDRLVRRRIARLTGRRAACR